MWKYDVYDELLGVYFSEIRNKTQQFSHEN